MRPSLLKGLKKLETRDCEVDLVEERRKFVEDSGADVGSCFGGSCGFGDVGRLLVEYFLASLLAVVSGYCHLG